MEQRSTASTKVAFALVCVTLAVQAYRAATLPVGTGEAYLYDRFVRPSTRQVFASELPDGNVLYCVLEKRSVGLFHVSPFAVRLPSLVFGVLFFFAVWRLARVSLGEGWKSPVAMAVFAAISLIWGWFARADGTGTALALFACAAWLAVVRQHLNLIGICLGLSITSDTKLWIPALAFGLTVLVLRRRWWEWIDRVAVPAAVAVVILLAIPASHFHAPAERPRELTRAQAMHLRSALDALRADAGTRPIRIAAAVVAEPIVNFYRAEHRANNWERASLEDSTGNFDYYVVRAGGAVRAGQSVYRNGDFAVLRAPF